MTEPDEHDVRELLGTALRGEPSSTLDLAHLRKLGRRRLRVQRTSAALGVVVVAGGVALGAGLLRHNDTGSSPDQITAAAPSSTPAPNPTAVTATPATLTPGSDIVGKQTAALRQAYEALTDLSPVTGELSFIPNQPTDQGYAGSQLIVRLGDHSGTGDFSMNATAAANGDASQLTCKGTKFSCTIQAFDGITVETETEHLTTKATRIFTFALSYSGKVFVDGTVDNVASPKSAALTRPTPPLSADQLARITAEVAGVSP
jgi:hypothetical protein